MSGVFKGIGKIFKAVGNVVGDVVHGIKKAVVTLWHSPIVRAVVIAVAAYFTAGAIAGAFAASGAGAGSAAAGAVGSAGAAAGGGSFFGGAMTAADITSGVGAMYGGGAAVASGIGAGAAGGLAAADAAGLGMVGADAAGTAAGGLGIGATAATSGLPDAIASGNVGFDIGTNATYATSLTGEMNMAAFSGQGVTETSLLAGQPAEVAAANGANVAASGVSPELGAQAASNVSSVSQDFTSNAFDTTGTGQGFQSFEQGNGLLASDGTPAATAGTTAPADTTAATSTAPSGGFVSDVKSIGTDIGHGVANVGHGIHNFLFGAPGTDVAVGDGTVSAGGGGGLLSSPLSKEMLISGLMNVGSQLLAKPQPQMQFAGVRGNGSGNVIGVQTTPGGFGLQLGAGQPAPTGVPQSIRPPGAPGLMSGPATPQVASAAHLPTMPALAAPAPPTGA